MNGQRERDSADLVFVLTALALAVFSVVFVLVVCGFNWEV